MDASKWNRVDNIVDGGNKGTGKTGDRMATDTLMGIATLDGDRSTIDLLNDLPTAVPTSQSDVSISAATLEISSNVVLNAPTMMAAISSQPVVHQQQQQQQHPQRLDAADVEERQHRSSFADAPQPNTSRHLVNQQRTYLLDNENTNTGNNPHSNGQMEYHFNPLYTISDSSRQEMSARPFSGHMHRPRTVDVPMPEAPLPMSYVPTSNLASNQSSPPGDPYNFIYVSLLIAGISYLLPYYCFILSTDHFVLRYDNPWVAFDMNFVYILTALVTVIVNNLTIEQWPLFLRLRTGYLLCLFLLIWVLVMEIFLEIGSYRLLLVYVGIVGVGCTLQQSTFYGYASMLPRKYTQALMTGESAAGIFQTFIFILIKATMEDYYHLPAEEAIIVFFLGSIFLVVMAYCFHTRTMPATPFVRYYLRACGKNKRNAQTEEQRVMSQINENVNLVNLYSSRQSNAGNSNSNNNNTDTLSLGNDLMPPTSVPNSRANSLSREGAMAPAGNVNSLLRTSSNDSEIFFGIDEEEYEQIRRREQQQQQHQQQQQLSVLEDILTQQQSHESERISTSEFQPRSMTTTLVSIITWIENATHSLQNLGIFVRQIRQWDLAKGFLLQRYYSRRAVARKIWPQLLSVGLVYFVTLNLVPGIAMEIQSCRFREWMPLILFTNFTATDFLGRMITPWFYHVTSYQILLVALLRFILVPLVSFCIMPEFSLFYNEPFWPQLFITILGLTNGIFGALPMILAPNYVPEASREIAGNLMTGAYILGLACGSFSAFGLNNLITNRGGYHYKLVCPQT